MDAANPVLRATITLGGSIHIDVSTNSVEVAKELINKLDGKAVSRGLGVGLALGGLALGGLGALLGYKYLKPLIEDAVRRSFGGERDDQEFHVRAGSLHILLKCFTDERFLEVLADYGSGRIKERLQKEFLDIGIKTEGLEMKIENVEEVNKTKEAINKRYKSHYIY